MKNEWRTLKEILNEGKTQIWLESRNSVKAFFVGPSENGLAVLSWESQGVGISKQDEPCWRVYEEPKQLKKWAPAAAKDGKELILLYRYFASQKEAQQWEVVHGVNRGIIWPAPGFTPVEIPE